MSFPKAKLHRFNDEVSCAPPPGTYDPKFEQKVKGAVIVKGERFKLEHASSVESLDSICSSSTAQHSIFRTPTTIRKKPVATPRSAATGPFNGRMPPTRIPVSEPKVKKKLNYLFKTETGEQKLIEQIDELARVHTSQLLEKDREISALHNEIDALKVQIEADNKKEHAIRSEYETIIEKLKREVVRFEAILGEEKEERQKCIDKLYSRVADAEKSLTQSYRVDEALRRTSKENEECVKEMNAKYSALEAKLQEAKEEMETLVRQHEKELESIAAIHDSQLKGIAEETEKNIDGMNSKLESNLKELEQEFDIVNLELQTGFRHKMEFVIRETEQKANDLENYVAAVSFKIKDMEAEFARRIADFETGLERCREWNENMMTEYMKTVEENESRKAVILEQKITIVELQEKIDSSEEELQQMRTKCRKYEIVHSEITKTVQVLSKRLFESETDVENLNRQQKEMKLKCSLLEEKVKTLIEADKAARANMEEIQLAIVRDVKEIEDQLLAKVDTYRKIAAEEAQKMKKTVEEKQKAVEMLASEVDFYRGKADESVVVISKLKMKLSECAQELKRSQSNMMGQQEELNKKLSAQTALYESLKEEYDSFKECAESRIDSLRKRVTELEAESLSLQQLHQQDSDLINELETRLEDEKSKLKIAETVLKTGEEENSSLRIINKELTDRLSAVQQSHSEDTEKIQALVQEKEEIEMRIVKLEEEAVEKEMRFESVGSELRENRVYAEQMTEHLVAVMNELADAGRRIEELNRELEYKTATAVQVSEEYENLRRTYEAQLKRTDDLEMDNQKYVDELISELVLEKERCAELTTSAEQLSAALQDTNAAAEQHKRDLEAAREELALLKESAADQEKLMAAQDEAARLQERLEHAELQLANLRGDKNMLEQALTSLQQLMGEKEEESKLMMQSALQAHDDLTRLQDNLRDTRTELEEARVRLSSAEEQLIQVREEKDGLEEQLEAANEENRRVNNQLINVEHTANLEAQKDITSMKKINAALSETNEKLKLQADTDSATIESLRANVCGLEARNRELESIIGPFKSQLIQFEEERAHLLSRTQYTENELRDLELKHAKSMGHQNNKQKIRHVINLTGTIAEQRKELDKLRTENYQMRQKLGLPHTSGPSKLGKQTSGQRGGAPDKENPLTTSGTRAVHNSTVAATATAIATLPPIKIKSERHLSPASILKQRNGL